MKSNKSISQIIFLTKFYFLQFQNWSKINFWTGKKFKMPKMQIHEKIFFDLFDFTSFFACTFLNFLAHCAKISQGFQTWRKKIQLTSLSIYSLSSRKRRKEQSSEDLNVNRSPPKEFSPFFLYKYGGVKFPSDNSHMRSL